MIGCPFCDEEIMQFETWLETENFRTVYNIKPFLEGHSLIMPKKHIESILELNEGEVSEMFNFALKVGRLLNYVFKTEGMNWVLQDKAVSGQTIPHLHLHIIPRTQDDFPKPSNWIGHFWNISPEEFERNSKSIISRDKMEKEVKKLRNAVVEMR